MKAFVSVMMGMAPFLDAAALGLGDATLESRLNQPLEVRIALVGADLDASNLNATVGSEAQQSAAGIELVELSRRLRAEVFITGTGEGYIRVSTERSIREPVVNFLLVVENVREHVMREYTLLLDPPGYSLPTVARPQSRPQPRPQPRPRAEPAGAARVPVTRVRAPKHELHPVHVGPVARGETLSKLALGIRRDRGVTWAQMTWALFTANPHAFIDGNINRLRAGVYLRVPSAASASRWSHREALALINGAPAERKVAETPTSEPPGAERVAPTVAVYMGNEPILSSAPPQQESPQQESPQQESRQQALRQQASRQQASPETVPTPLTDPQPASPQPLFRLAPADVLDEPRTNASAGVSITPDERQRIDQMIVMANQQIQDSQEEIARARWQLADTAKQISTLVTTVAKKDSEIKGLESRIADLRQLIKEQTIAIARSESGWTHRLLLEAFLLAAMVVVLAVTLSRWTDVRRRREASTEVKTIFLEPPAPARDPAETATTVVDSEIDFPQAEQEADARAEEEADARAEEECDAEASTDGGLSIDHVEFAEQAISDDPLTEANAYFAYGYHEKAKDVLTEIIKENPAYAESRLLMLRVLHVMREKRKFRRHAEALLELVDDRFDERWLEAARLGRALFPEERLFNADIHKRSEDSNWEETIWTGTRPVVPENEDQVYLDIDEFKYVDLFLLDEADDAEANDSLDASLPEPAENQKTRVELAKWRKEILGDSEDSGCSLDGIESVDGSLDDEHS